MTASQNRVSVGFGFVVVALALNLGPLVCGSLAQGRPVHEQKPIVLAENEAAAILLRTFRAVEEGNANYNADLAASMRRALDKYPGAREVFAEALNRFRNLSPAEQKTLEGARLSKVPVMDKIPASILADLRSSASRLKSEVLVDKIAKPQIDSRSLENALASPSISAILGTLKEGEKEALAKQIQEEQETMKAMSLKKTPKQFRMIWKGIRVYASSDGIFGGGIEPYCIVETYRGPKRIAKRWRSWSNLKAGHIKFFNDVLFNDKLSSTLEVAITCIESDTYTAVPKKVDAYLAKAELLCEQSGYCYGQGSTITNLIKDVLKWFSGLVSDDFLGFTVLRINKNTAMGVVGCGVWKKSGICADWAPNFYHDGAGLNAYFDLQPVY